jgi:hypothetical protein
MYGLEVERINPNGYTDAVHPAVQPDSKTNPGPFRPFLPHSLSEGLLGVFRPVRDRRLLDCVGGVPATVMMPV